MSKRSYHQFCGVARALDVLGERWTLLIVRDLLLGPMRYVDLMRSLEGITTNLLAARLKHLESAGLIEKHRLPPPAAASVYSLTALGEGLRTLVLELGRFGATTMASGPASDDKLDIRWAMVSLMRRFRGTPRPAVLQLGVGERSFVVRMSAETLVTEEGSSDAAVVRITGDEATWWRWLSANASTRELLAERRLHRHGGPLRPFLDLARAVRCLP